MARAVARYRVDIQTNMKTRRGFINLDPLVYLALFGLFVGVPAAIYCAYKIVSFLLRHIHWA